MPRAIGRSNAEPTLRTSAGDRLTVTAGGETRTRSSGWRSGPAVLRAPGPLALPQQRRRMCSMMTLHRRAAVSTLLAIVALGPSGPSAQQPTGRSSATWTRPGRPPGRITPSCSAACAPGRSRPWERRRRRPMSPRPFPRPTPTATGTPSRSRCSTTSSSLGRPASPSGACAPPRGSSWSTPSSTTRSRRRSSRGCASWGSIRGRSAISSSATPIATTPAAPVSCSSTGRGW